MRKRRCSRRKRYFIVVLRHCDGRRTEEQTAHRFDSCTILGALTQTLLQQNGGRAGGKGVIGIETGLARLPFRAIIRRNTADCIVL